MIQPDFNTMTKTELRAYVVANPDDRLAFEVFVDRFTAEASSEIFPKPQSIAEVKEVENLIQQRVKQLKLLSSK